MSDTVESLRHKIESARELKGVVRTMKTLSAVSIRQYERAVRALEDYFRTVELGLAASFRLTLASEWIEARQTPDKAGGLGAVVFGSDQGLVGQFNNRVVDFAMSEMAAWGARPAIWVVGERACAHLREAGRETAGLFPAPSSAAGIISLVGEILLQCEGCRERGDLARLHLFHNQPQPGGGYAPVSTRLLPLDAEWLGRLARIPWPSARLPEVIGGGATMRALVREYIFVSLFRACAESLASENASRLAAMQRAEKNIDELQENLGHAFHRLRQSSIDEELFDLISGFEAIEGAVSEASRGR